MTIAPDKSAAPPAEDLVNVTIDGFEIAVPKGTLLIRAAELLGIQVPRFCDHPLLDPAGACRQCLVEITDMGNGRGMPKPQASCTITVTPGMVVKTQLTSPVADKAQQGVMELLLINHPLDCPICDKGGECPLQNQAMSNGRAESRFHDVKRTFAKPLAISSLVLLDRERCVLCQRCTRFSAQIAGDPFIDLLERGAQQQVGTSTDTPFQSYFSGNTIQICPVGALTSASYRFRARPFDLMSSRSVCEHCAGGCATRTDWRRSKITRKLAGDDPEVNEEWLCDKGRFAFKYDTLADRLLEPLVRDENGELVPASWPEALERAAQGLAAARAAGGVGVLPGGRLTIEDAYAYSKFARLALGTNDIDFRARPVGAGEQEFLAAHIIGTSPANGGVTFRALEAAPTVLLAGIEAEDEAATVFLRLRKSTRVGKLKVYAIAPLATRGLEKLSGTLLPTVPGGEAAALRDLPADVIAALSADGAVIVAGERLAAAPGALAAASALAARTGAKLAFIPRRAGDRGAIESGALPGLLPGGRSVADVGARAEVEAIWRGSVPAQAGRDVDEIIAAAATGQLGGLLVGGVDPADLAYPELAMRALAGVGFVVSLEIRASAVTDHADVVLPVSPASEKAGSYLNWEGRVRPFGVALSGATSMSDHRVLNALADEFDVNLGLPTADTVWAELERLLGSAPEGAREIPAGEAPAAPAAAGAGHAVLAMWSELLNAGRLQDGEDALAGTAKPLRALLGAATAAGFGVTDGGAITVSTDAGSITAPVMVADGMVEGVVWLPANTRGAEARAALQTAPGATVGIAVVEAGRTDSSLTDEEAL
jgi:NADH-quinone oxidoreductase subunit G